MLKRFILLLTLCSALLQSAEIVHDFESENLTTWKQLGSWSITLTEQGKVLSLQQKSGRAFNLCYTKKIQFLDGSVTVRFKANSGRIDQGGGIMWRVQDDDNYYVARFNPLEDNFRFYSVKKGNRREIASADVTLSPGWHEMKIVQKGAQFEGYIDGKRYLEAENRRLMQSGGVGVWTKADALTSFDDLTVINGE